MALAQQVTSMIHSLRKKEAISVKQPLQRIAIPALNAEQQERIEAMKQLILDEVNVKEIEFVEGAGMLVKKVKCNFRTMGKKFGKQMKSIDCTRLRVNNLISKRSILRNKVFTISMAFCERGNIHSSGCTTNLTPSRSNQSHVSCGEN